MRAFLAILAVAAAPIAALAFVGRRRGPTPLRGLGAATTTCAPNPGGVRVCLTRPTGPLPRVDDPHAVCRMLRAAGQRDRESFYTIAIDTQNQVLGVEEVAKGRVDTVEVHPRETFKAALLMNAAGVVIAHNHPSGDPSPSESDVKLTRRLISVGKLVGIPVIDHVVVGHNKCVSMAKDYGHLFEDNAGD